MSAFDGNPRKNVLERLRDRERGRDWSALDKTYRNRSWSADSYTGEKFVPPRKPGSPAYLPKLENRPASVDSDYEHDLKRGNLRVIPPLPAGEQHGVSQRDDQIKRKISRKENQAFQDQSSSYPYAALPSYYPHPPVAPPPHPPLMYPVPMIPVHPGYAPWIVPQQGFNGVNSGLFNAHHAERPPHQLSRSQAAVVIQKYHRGWQVRKGPRFALWRHMCNRKYSRKFVDDLINSFLIEELVPDVLIDVLVGKKFLSVQDPRYKASERVCKEIIDQDVTSFIHEVALGVYYAHQGIAYSRRDPSVKACDSIIGEVVQEFAGQVVRSVVEEKVVGHMAVIKAGDWLEDFILETIEPMIPVVVSEAMDGFQNDDPLDEVIDEVITSELRQIVIDVWREMLEVDREKQVKKLSVYAEDRLLDSLCLQHLLSQLAGDNLSFHVRGYAQQALDGMLCGLLIRNYLAVNDQLEATQSSAAVKEFHEEVFCDVALDVLLEELTANLDEDMQDLLEHENQRNTFDL